MLIKSNANIFLSEEILEELSKVLMRDFEKTYQEINELLNILIPYFNIVEPINRISIIKDDPEDNKILECAIESRSSYILTYDKHLLVLQNFQGIEIITPDQFFKILNVP